jgi:hypothetical protein
MVAYITPQQKLQTLAHYIWRGGGYKLYKGREVDKDYKKLVRG